MIHILVVEDDERLNRIVCTYLNDSGFLTKLRNKLSDCDGFKIVTVRGLGYKAVLQ